MINGIMNVYKEKGYTSHDVVAKLRGILGQRKIGHTGTLDPDAEGVLLAALGKATKVCDMLTDKDKTYEAVLLFGKTTDTQDISGTVLKEQETGALSEQEIKDCIHGYIGEYEQLPPMYSALKVNGKKLYELAREGRVVERKTRRVLIHDIQIKRIELPRVFMEVTCSKGTYIRTLCHDIGQRLKTGACMESLKRTKVGRFDGKDSLKLSEIEAHKRNGSILDIIIPIDELFLDLPGVIVGKEHTALAYNGNPLKQSFLNGAEAPRIRLYDEEGHFIGIYGYDSQKNEYKLEKMFLDNVKSVDGLPFA